MPTVESIREQPEEAWTYSYQGRDEITDISGLVPVSEETFAAIYLSTGESKPSRVAMVDGETGEETWTVPLESLGIDPMAWPELLPVSPEGHLTVAVTDSAVDSEGDRTWDATEVYLIALDPSDGRVVSETTMRGHAYIAQEYGAETAYFHVPPPQAVVVQRDGGLVRLDTSDLEGDPVWSANIPDVYTTEIVGDFVRVSTAGTEWWLDVDTGFEPDWFVGEGEEVMFLPTFDSMILRFEYADSGIYYLDGLDEEGGVMWSAEPDMFHAVASPTGRMLFFSEYVESDDGPFRYLMRIDPLTGDEMWDQEYEEPFWSAFEQTVDGQLVVHVQDSAVLVEAETGERTHRLRGRPVTLATDVIYTTDEDRLRAMDAGNGDELWSLRLRTEDEVVSIGSMLVTFDAERGQITRLR
ncbi:PQQ-binding-like beta-propeller repeat protein [Brachybacterium saurashtrense]|uniref:outer membrane protein assembly factor BamB family protein n=1 Tax=Brachybacterium saurashtrense TaxID=556288 RepID=UPI0013E020DA|nr:PQQ-binding-like beta-propeller repeat protein [Brachybacterium saurashtrense]